MKNSPTEQREWGLRGGPGLGVSMKAAGGLGTTSEQGEDAGEGTSHNGGVTRWHRLMVCKEGGQEESQGFGEMR